MKISYAVTVCNEFLEIQTLLQKLITLKKPQDEIVVLWDSKNGDKGVETYLRKMNVGNTYFRWYPYEFDGHFADLKNELTKHCKGDYIFQIDADEYPHETLMDNIHSILEENDVDVILVPRVNTRQKAKNCSLVTLSPHVPISFETSLLARSIKYCILRTFAPATTL